MTIYDPNPKIDLHSAVFPATDTFRPDEGVRADTAALRASILDDARQAVMFDRAATHGDAEKTFGLIAALWSPLVGKEITASQAALMLGALKIARAWGNAEHLDNYVDLAGYAACAGELALAQKPAPESAP